MKDGSLYKLQYERKKETCSTWPLRWYSIYFLQFCNINSFTKLSLEWKQRHSHPTFEMCLLFCKIMDFNLYFSCFLPLSRILPPLCFLSLPVPFSRDSESESPSSLRIECSFMIVPPLSNQLIRRWCKWSEITCVHTVKIKIAARNCWKSET